MSCLKTDKESFNIYFYIHMLLNFTTNKESFDFIVIQYTHCQIKTLIKTYAL